jgi:PAS domain S-box-containing protein
LMNRFLEKRVEKRTAQWKNANELLEQEIAGRNQIERALQESKLRYRRMVNNVTDHMCVHDLAGTIVDVNHRVISGLGFSHKELVGRQLQDVIVPEQRLNFGTYLRRLRQGRKVTGKVTFISKTGQLLFMEFSSVKARHTEEGDVVYCLARDVTERQQTQKALAESQARFKDIFETAAAGMMIVNRKSRTIVEVNPAAAQMIREPVRDIKGRLLDQLIRTDTPPAGDLQTPSCLSDVDPAECRLTCGRETIPILQTIRPMEFSGQPHWLISFINLQKIKEAESAQREAESHLNRAQHLQAIGTLAGGIAHDFNNILYGVIGYAQLALDDASRGTVLHDNIREILQGCHRAKELVGQIMTFSRQDESQKKSVHLTPLIKEALNLLRASIPTTIEIQTDIAQKTAPVLANSTQIHQVIMNLCTNAAQSMLPQGGHLRVVLEELDIKTEENALHGPVAAGAYVRLAVIDTGCGIQEELKYRIFEPFFTTKTHGQGTGMGLAVVLGAVQAHGGAIRLDSEPGKGTRFEILLPAIKSSRELEPDPHVALTGGRERLLLVDDEKALIQMGLQMLTRLGYHVTPFQDPLKALQAFHDRPADFDLVITDLTMPKMKGTRLAQHMLHLKPEIPIILCTGYGDEVTHEQIEEIGIRELLLKPILRQHLAFAIRKALESPVVESSHS